MNTSKQWRSKWMRNLSSVGVIGIYWWPQLLFWIKDAKWSWQTFVFLEFIQSLKLLQTLHLFSTFFMSCMRCMWKLIIHHFCNKVLKKLLVLQVVLLQVLLYSKFLLVEQFFSHTSKVSILFDLLKRIWIYITKRVFI